MKVATTYNNFSRAKLDHDMQGRFDLPIYFTSADTFENFISNFKGNAIYRAGFQQELTFQDCAFVEYKYSDNQNYLLVLYNTKMRFASFDTNNEFGWVESSPGVPLEITTPYTLAQSKEISLDFPSQNFDVMVFTHLSHAPRKLIRLSATSFSFNEFARKDDPFGLTYAASKTISGITKAANANLTIVAHGYSVDDMIKISDVSGMTEINGYTARVVTVPGVDNITIDVDTTNFSNYSPHGITEKRLTGDWPAHNLFYGSRLWYGATTLKPTTIYGSEVADYDIYTIPTTVLPESALSLTIAVISQKIEWMFAGDNSMVLGSADGLVAVNGGDIKTPITAETVDATLTSADGSSNAYPIKKDGLIFYVSKNKRNVNYFGYEILSESFVAQDANFISYDITEGDLNKIRYKKDRNDLIFGLRGDNALCSLNFNKNENVIGWHELFLAGETLDGFIQDLAVINDNTGAPVLFALNKYGNAFYIESQGEYISFKKRVKFFTNDRKADNDAYRRYTAEQLKECIYLDNAQVVSGLQNNVITFNGTDTITATSAVFSSGDVGKNITYKTLTGYEYGRFEITGFTNSTTVTVNVLQTPSTNTYTDWYLSFSTLSGLSQYNNTTVSIVSDGGYLADYEVLGGVLSLEKQVNHVVIGYKYKGIIETFTQGFSAQTENTQTTEKVTCEVHVRASDSVGGKVGTSLYNLQAVQKLEPDALNYLPAQLLDGTTQVDLNDDNDVDKRLFLVQDVPGPFTLNFMIPKTNYAIDQ